MFNGIVEIKSISREAGFRSKVAVAARQEGIDPVGCCVGLRGIRIQNIVNELNGEKIDVVAWNKDVPAFIANSLSPAQVLNVELNNDVATVVVPDKHLSLAIGKDGQNARLAAKLTGWRIDIKSASAVEAERAAKAPPKVEVKAKEATAPVQTEIPAQIEPAAIAEPVPLKEPVAQTVPVVQEKPLTPAEQDLLDEMIADSKEEAAKIEEKEEGQAETVLSSTFIPRRIIQPRDEGKTTIRFAEDIFTNRPGRTEDKSRKKKKKHTSKGKASGGGDDEG